jgi:hypothetical protein
LADLAQLKADLDAAEAAKAALVDERRTNRDAMPKKDWLAYNRDSKQAQKDVQRAVVEANVALAHALGKVKSDAVAVALGTITETDGGG